MDAQLAAEKLSFVALSLAGDVLEQTGTVPPLGILLAPEDDDIFTYYPHDLHRSASWDELITLVVSELRDQAANEEYIAAAVVTVLESGDDRAIGIQIETQETAIALIAPYKKTDEGWKISPLSQTDRLFTGRIFFFDN